MKHSNTLTIAVLLASAAMARAEPSIYPTGVTIYDPTLAYNSYVVFGGTDHKTHLIDMDGNEVHRWDYAGFPSEILDPAVTGGKRGTCHCAAVHRGAPSRRRRAARAGRIPQPDDRRARLGRQALRSSETDNSASAKIFASSELGFVW